VASGQDVGIARASRGRWSAAKAAAVLREAEQSEQNLTEFCRARDLNYERVRRWRVRLNAAPKPKRAAFVPVHVVDVARHDEDPKQESKVPGLVEFEVGGCVVRLHGDVSDAVLVRALRAARQAAGC
jgi:predicted MarR family transcription regulator